MTPPERTAYEQLSKLSFGQNLGCAEARRILRLRLRPWLLFDEDGKPTHLFCASGNGPAPYAFEGETYIVCLRLETQA